MAGRVTRKKVDVQKLKHCSNSGAQNSFLNSKKKGKLFLRAKPSKDINRTCSVCNLSFRALKDFKQHLEVVKCGGRQRFPCNICNKAFSKHESYKAHQDIHNGTQQKYLCNTCNAEFNWKHSLIYHLNKKSKCTFKRSKNIITICNICNFSFTKRKDFRQHIETVGCGGKEKFPCNVCGKMFSFLGSLKGHRKFHDGTQDEYFCDTCNARFNQKANLQKHLTKRSNCYYKRSKDIQRICSICKWPFTQTADFMEHLKTFECGGRERFPCRVCNRNFSTLGHLKIHKEIHESTRKKYVCHNCNAEFICKKSLINHFRKKDGRKRVYTIGNHRICSVCKSSFMKREDLKEHLKSVGCGGRERFPCDVCEKSFLYLSHLKRHKGSHNDISYICDTCNSIFTLKDSLLNHIKNKLCKDKRSIGLYRICSVCDCSFTNREGFKQHIKTVGCGGSERFPCNNCHRSFSTYTYCKTHQESCHIPIKKHYSETCNAQFTRESSLIEHQIKHHGQTNISNSVVKYTCTYCYSSFGKKWDLNKHIQTAGCRGEHVKVEAESILPLESNSLASSGMYSLFTSSPSSSAIQLQDDLSPVISPHEDTFRVYVFKNINSIDFSSFVSSKVNAIKETIHAEMEYHLNKVKTEVFMSEDVECVEVKGKSEKEVLETFGSHRSQFFPISNTLQIDNTLTHMLDDAMCSYKRECGII